MPGLLDEDAYLIRGSYLGEHTREGNLQLHYLGSSQFCHISRQHIILDLYFKPYEQMTP